MAGGTCTTSNLSGVNLFEFRAPTNGGKHWACHATSPAEGSMRQAPVSPL
jgi:hypothetical protein